MKNTILIALAALLLAGCLPIEEVHFDSTVRPPKAEVEVFHDGRIPSRWCREITSYLFNGNTGDQAKAERAFIERAKTNGADGLVFFPPQLVDPSPNSNRRIYKASAVLFGPTGADGFADPARLFPPSAFASPVHVSAGSSTPTARPDTDAPFRVARICEEGSQRRSAFFESSIEYLQRLNASGTYRADIEELKHLREGEIGLQRELNMFRKYVAEGKPWLMTDEETTQCLSESRDRSAYFLRNLDMVKGQRSEGKITEADYNAESAFITMLADEDEYLQKVLIQFAADKLAYEQRLKTGISQQTAAVAPATGGESTFQKLLSLAILAKSLQTQQPNIVVIKRN